MPVVTSPPGPDPTPVRPAYDGAWIGAVAPALLGETDGGWLPEPARSAEQAVLLVLDGLGWHAMEDLGGRLPELAAMDGGPITTCAPSTTSAALTSITTGLPPAQHGIVGFRIAAEGGILTVLYWTHSGGETSPDPAVVQPHDGGARGALPARRR